MVNNRLIFKLPRQHIVNILQRLSDSLVGLVGGSLASNQTDVQRSGKKMSIQSKSFSRQSLDPIALYRPSNLAAHGDADP